MLDRAQINAIRKKFPVTEKLIYFDHAAVSPIHIDVKDAVNAYLNDLLEYGDRNYSEWWKKTEEIRSGMAEFIGAGCDEIAFIKNTSHGISLVAGGLDFNAGDEIIIPDIEFPANVYPWLGLEKKGVKIIIIKSQDGTIPLNCLAANISNKTKLISISSVQYSSGYRSDLKAISEIIKQKSNEYGHKIYFCVDGIQSLGALKLDVKEYNIDFLAADGHKWFLTPEGIGIFFCKQENISALNPVLLGWKSVSEPTQFTNINFDLPLTAKKFEEGSFNMMGVVALGASLKLFESIGIDKIESRILYITRLLIEALNVEGYTLHSPVEDRYRSGIISFSRQGSCEELYSKFYENGVQLSIRAGRIRISPHFYNTEEEVDRFAKLL